MLKINTKANPEGRWYKYAEGVEFQIRPLTSQVLRDLRKSVTQTRMEVNPTTRVMVSVDHVDDDKYNDVLNDHLLMDWKGIGNEDGEPLECNLENKKLILNQIPLRDFIWGAAQALDIEADREKN
jgi:hypothetical protein